MEGKSHLLGRIRGGQKAPGVGEVGRQRAEPSLQDREARAQDAAHGLCSVASWVGGTLACLGVFRSGVAGQILPTKWPASVQSILIKKMPCAKL